MNPTLTVDPPGGWTTATVDLPPVAEGSGAVFTQAHAWRSPDTTSTLVAACVATPIPGWVEDLRGPVLQRTRGVALATASRAQNAALLSDFATDPAILTASRPGASAPRNAGTARTFLGFPSSSDDPHRIFACFATCTSAREDAPESPVACADSVATARLEGSGPPPSPGHLLATAAWAVDHPSKVAVMAFALVALASVLAVWGRRRPRASI